MVEDRGSDDSQSHRSQENQITVQCQCTSSRCPADDVEDQFDDILSSIACQAVPADDLLPKIVDKE